MRIAGLVNKLRNIVLINSSYSIYLQYSRHLQKRGLRERYFVLSFDCDTAEDAIAAERIAEWLRVKRIPAVFAVPGKRIESACNTFKGIADMGFEFLNHGYLEHAAYDETRKKYYSITFYAEMREEEIRQDIVDGDRYLQTQIGVKPKGFRAPHFGNFQRPEQLKLIYSVLSELGYSYSTTTMPEYGLRNGGVFEAYNGIVEFPLTGTYDNPHVVLDSWQFLAAPDRVYKESDYVEQFKKMVNFFSNMNLPCILNYYVDPFHVVNFDGFFNCIEYALDKKIRVSTYSRILSEFKGVSLRGCAE